MLPFAALVHSFAYLRSFVLFRTLAFAPFRTRARDKGVSLRWCPGSLQHRETKRPFNEVPDYETLTIIFASLSQESALLVL